ncbi:MAG: hypothetical protein NC833_03765 [Candidatus Omnitrophica bacterium]|nr:hypothetical protein [Candidatus Omnitrophota bacterium]
MIEKEEILNGIDRGINWVLNIQKENGCFHGDFIWHDGQAIRSLIYTYRRKKDEKLLNSAKKCGDFILSLQNLDKNSKLYGTYETPAYTSRKQIAPSDIYETLSGIIELYKETNETKYIESAKLAADWIIKNLHSPGVIGQVFDIEKWEHLNPLPIHDDASFLMLYKETKEEKYLNTFIDQIKVIIEKQDINGNWFFPHYFYKEVRPVSGRSLYWLNYPLLEAYKFFRYNYIIPPLIRGIDNILRNQLWDGSIRAGINTDGTFYGFGICEGNDGTATSMCSIILLDAYLLFYDEKYLTCAKRALRFILDNQREDGQFYHSKIFKDNKWQPFQRDISTYFGIIALEKYIKVVLSKYNL